MLRSFVTLASCLNLSAAVRELGVTRQTIRRHIKELELLKGERLFEQIDRHYQLTPAGTASLPVAESLLASAEAWVRGEAARESGLAHVSVDISDDDKFHAQQHPINQIWSIAPPLIQRGLQDWTTAQSHLEHCSLKKVRPYMVVYRRHGDEWLCVDVGEKSSYASWLGWRWAKSAVGRSFTQDPIHSDADRFMIRAYDSVSLFGGVWYDHVSTRFPRREGGEPQSVNYQRLVAACTFPDGAPAVAALVARTDKIIIEGLDCKTISKTPDADLMEFNI